MSLGFSYRHLYYFWVVAKEGGMARGAARLGMAVQTVSAQRQRAAPGGRHCRCAAQAGVATPAGAGDA